MEKIIVGFSRPKKWKLFAWLIQEFYGIEYDHVYLKLYSSSYDRYIIYQASSVMVNFMGSFKFNEENVIYKEFEVDISPENKRALMQFAIDNAGKPYSLKEVLGFAIVGILEKFGKKISNPFKDGTKEFICSEIGSYILENYTAEVMPKDYEDMSPKDLFEFLSSRYQ